MELLQSSGFPKILSMYVGGDVSVQPFKQLRSTGILGMERVMLTGLVSLKRYVRPTYGLSFQAQSHRHSTLQSAVDSLPNPEEQLPLKRNVSLFRMPQSGQSSKVPSKVEELFGPSRKRFLKKNAAFVTTSVSSVKFLQKEENKQNTKLGRY